MTAITMARNYILTKKERETLKRFLETGEKLDGFSVLLYYLNKARPQLEADLNLVDRALTEKRKATR
jgi:hypothetical protein